MFPRRDAAEQEAARLRYELSRLLAKRSVRIALLAGRGAARDAVRTIRGERVRADLDVLIPAVTEDRPRYPHLRVAHSTDAPPFGWVAPHVHVGDPADLGRADADLLVTTPRTWRSPLVDEARRLNVPVVVLRGSSDPIPGGADLLLEVSSTGDADGADTVAPWIDARTHNPIGWNPAATPVTVTASAVPTETTRRVLALLAQGRTVHVDSDVVGHLPHDVRDLVTSDATSDATERDQIVTSRHVLAHHEALARFEVVLGRLGIPVRPPPRISALLATRRPSQLDHALAQIERQDHEDVEIVVVLHGTEFPDGTADRVRSLTKRPVVVQMAPDDALLGDVLNMGLDAATGDLVAKMDDDDHYGPRHLSDLHMALTYSGADIVGRWANEVHLADLNRTVTQDLDRQERWAHHLPGATVLIHGDVIRALRFRRVARAVDTHLLRAVHQAGGSAYATHRFGFVRTRRTGGHTFERRPRAFGDDDARPGLDTSVLEP